MMLNRFIKSQSFELKNPAFSRRETCVLLVHSSYMCGEGWGEPQGTIVKHKLWLQKSREKGGMPRRRLLQLDLFPTNIHTLHYSLRISLEFPGTYKRSRSRVIPGKRKTIFSIFSFVFVCCLETCFVIKAEYLFLFSIFSGLEARYSSTDALLIITTNSKH